MSRVIGFSRPQGAKNTGPTTWIDLALPCFVLFKVKLRGRWPKDLQIQMPDLGAAHVALLVAGWCAYRWHSKRDQTGPSCCTTTSAVYDTERHAERKSAYAPPSVQALFGMLQLELFDCSIPARA